MDLIQLLLAAKVVILAFLYDIKQMRIPNWVNYSGAGSGLAYHLITAGTKGFFASVASLCGIFAITWFLYMCRAIGAGDVKWYAALGAITNFSFSFYSLLFAVVISGFIAFIIIFWMRDNRPSHFPFMYAAAPGVVLTFFIL